VKKENRRVEMYRSSDSAVFDAEKTVCREKRNDGKCKTKYTGTDPDFILDKQEIKHPDKEQEYYRDQQFQVQSFVKEPSYPDVKKEGSGNDHQILNDDYNREN
jgi:hypothetical protein